jgi:DNA polymerase elongation subunit (family B)
MTWLCVCSFGYMGYRNARFGRIECHEAICAWGRELLITTSEIARAHGFEVVHGIVDSVWLTPTRADADAEAFAAATSERIGIPLGLEGWYDWIVFLPTRASVQAQGDAGALNRFYGAFRETPTKKVRSNSGQRVDYIEGGRVKVRGVELRQRSAPRVVRQAQESFLLEVAKATSPAEFRQRLPGALRAAKPVLDALAAGRVSLQDLLVLNMVAQEEEQYRANTLARCALIGLKAAGVRVPPGDSVRYVVLDAEARRPRERALDARLLRGDERYDAAHYAKLVLRSLESCALPFGWTAERIGQQLEGKVQADLRAFGAASA